MSPSRSVFVFAIVVVVLLAILTLWPKPEKRSEFAPELWDEFRVNFVLDGRVVDHDNGGISHSEGQGYGMIFAEAFGDRKEFDDLFSWTRNHLMRDDGLLSWRWEPGRGVTDENNATDGDILVAWALVRAAERWQDTSYLDEALSILSAIRTHAIVEEEGRLFILPGVFGFHKQDGLILNPSYWVYPALDDFAQVDSRKIWIKVAESGQWLTEQSAMPPNGLVPDWVQLTADGPKAAPDFPVRFSWDAVRIPLYIAWGADQRHGLLAPFQRYWERQFEDGDFPAWIDLETGEASPYPAPAGIRFIASIVTGKALAEGDNVKADESYFSSSLHILTLIAVAESDCGLQE
jgi:endoglucanase